MIGEDMRWRRTPLPTDYELLNAIYEQYYDVFVAHPPAGPRTRESKIYVPIDCVAVGAGLKVDSDIVFGRLYYHLEKKYGFDHPDGGGRVPLFTIAAGSDKHCVHFPLLSSVVAEMREEKGKYRIATAVAVVSLLVSIGAILVSIYA